MLFISVLTLAVTLLCTASTSSYPHIRVRLPHDLGRFLLPPPSIRVFFIRSFPLFSSFPLSPASSLSFGELSCIPTVACYPGWTRSTGVVVGPTAAFPNWHNKDHLRETTAKYHPVDADVVGLSYASDGSVLDLLKGVTVAETLSRCGRPQRCTFVTHGVNGAPDLSYWFRRCKRSHFSFCRSEKKCFL